jgi:hypothetical protein
MTKSIDIERLERRLREQAPAWRAQNLADRRDRVVTAPRPIPWIGLGAGLAAAAAIVIGLIVTIGGPTVTPPTERPVMMIRPIELTAVLDEPARSIERPLTSETDRLAADVKHAARSALGPLLALDRAPTPRPM